MNLSALDITTRKEKQFNNKGIFLAEQLVWFFPRSYLDCSQLTPLTDGEFCVIKVNVRKASTTATANGNLIRLSCSYIQNGISESVTVMFFNQSHRYAFLSSCSNQTVFCAGKATYSDEYHNWTFSNPFLFTQNINDLKIYPIYSKIKGMSESYLQDKIKSALNLIKIPDEITPTKFIPQSLQNLSLNNAIKALHSPSSITEIVNAKKRVEYEDLQYFASKLQWNSFTDSKSSPYKAFRLHNTNRLITSLPFELTEDQKATVQSIIYNSKRGARNNALVQGDVGCGKSIVAYLCMLSMADNGYQSVLMAPTQVLAEQHYRDFCGFVKDLNVSVGFLGGNTSKKEKKSVIDGVENGNINILIGTHAVLGDDLNFKNLSLIIVDEEHKFGVEQRNAILEKASEGVHYIKMSATPIPRSLASVIYGESTQLYSITTMPSGRKPVITKVVHNQESVNTFLLSQIKRGRQAYIVCPMIDDNEDYEVDSVEKLIVDYNSALDKYGVKIAALTGQTKKEDFDRIISEFVKNEINILIATTVIEVGINVPNSTTIVIHNAERFGLSGLHQLRGRVGRGSLQSYCFLFSDSDNNPRLETMCKTNDGFKIAEDDLTQRGSGNLIGTEQSGFDKFMTLMLNNRDSYSSCVSIAKQLYLTHELENVISLYEETVLANAPKKSARKKSTEVAS